MLVKISLLSFLSLFAISCAQPPAIFGEVPPFQLTDQTGTIVTKQDLKGKVWIADFIYSGCGAACPLLTQRMSELGKELGNDVRLVSFTVDPETDTPERLRVYSQRFGADPKQWSFLTGPVEAVRKTVSQGFKLSLKKTSPTDIFHSEKLVLVDGRGFIRGYYDSDQKGLQALKSATKVLERSKGHS